MVKQDRMFNGKRYSLYIIKDTLAHAKSAVKNARNQGMNARYEKHKEGYFIYVGDRK
jgi:hypothetical protein